MQSITIKIEFLNHQSLKSCNHYALLIVMQSIKIKIEFLTHQSLKKKLESMQSIKIKLELLQ